MIDNNGQPFYNPKADAALFNAIREHAGDAVELLEYDLHINDEAFADALVDKLLSLL